MPWRRVSRQAIRLFPLSSHERRASVVPEDCALREAEGNAVDGPASQLRTTISVDAQAASMRSKAFASRASTVKAYLRRTSTTRTANQQRFIDGIHCAASWCFLRLRSTSGPASVRLSRSEAKRRRVPAPAAPSRKAARNGEPTFARLACATQLRIAWAVGSDCLPSADNNTAVHEPVPPESVQCEPTRPSGAGRPAEPVPRLTACRGGLRGNGGRSRFRHGGYLLPKGSGVHEIGSTPKYDIVH